MNCMALSCCTSVHRCMWIGRLFPEFRCVFSFPFGSFLFRFISFVRTSPRFLPVCFDVQSSHKQSEENIEAIRNEPSTVCDGYTVNFWQFIAWLCVRAEINMAAESMTPRTCVCMCTRTKIIKWDRGATTNKTRQTSGAKKEEELQKRNSDNSNTSKGERVFFYFTHFGMKTMFSFSSNFCDVKCQNVV